MMDIFMMVLINAFNAQFQIVKYVLPQLQLHCVQHAKMDLALKLMDHVLQSFSAQLMDAELMLPIHMKNAKLALMDTT